MTSKRLRWAAPVTCVGLVTAGGLVLAADHIDSPTTTDDPAADITDVYAWQDGDKIVAAIAFDGLQEAGIAPVYDADVVYGLHIDTDADGVADHDVWARFGQNDAGDWGIQVSNLPGGDAVVEGPVDEVIDAGLGLRVFAGLRDDGFFFDLEGFMMTVESGTLMFDNTRDFFSNTNVHVIVFEMSTDGVAGGSDQVAIWASTRR
jgi:hypothetical protein